jgi:hypothetical protein
MSNEGETMNDVNPQEIPFDNNTMHHGVNETEEEQVTREVPTTQTEEPVRTEEPIPMEEVPLESISVEDKPEQTIQIPGEPLTTETKIYNRHPIQLSWKNLEYEVRVGGGIKLWEYNKKKTILHSMDGFVSPGQVLVKFTQKF